MIRRNFYFYLTVLENLKFESDDFKRKIQIVSKPDKRANATHPVNDKNGKGKQQDKRYSIGYKQLKGTSFINKPIKRDRKKSYNTWTAVCSRESSATDATITFTDESNLTNTSI